MSHRGFIVFGLPRSRTFWLSRFLTYRDWTCGHDEARHLRTMADVKAWFSQPCTGTVETAAAPFWRLVPEGVRVVVVGRPVDDVLASMDGLGLIGDRAQTEAYIRHLDRKLGQIACRVPGAISVRYAELAEEATCAALFEHCLPYRHDPAWWAALAPVNLQINMLATLRYMQAYRAPLEKLATIAKHRTIVGMQPPLQAPDGVVLQQEPFETFFRDGQQLFADHCTLLDEAPDSFLGKNIEVMRLLDQNRAMQITTARSNGRMFGYLMAVLSPSLESPNRTVAVHTTWFASPSFPGLGAKLQRASIEALHARGVNDVIFRSGPRGSGPKTAPLYRRLGAADYGQLFILEGAA